MAAGMERRALDQPASREPSTLQHTVGRHGLRGIMGARRMEAASTCRTKEDGQHRGRRALVHPDDANCGIGRQALARGNRRCHLLRHCEGRDGGAIRPQASVKARSIWANGQLLTWDRATSIRSIDAGSRSWWRRKISRILRLARFRRTALPTACVEATKHALRAAAASGFGNHQTVNALQSTRAPCWRTSRMSLWRRRCCPGRRRMGTAIPVIKRRSAACDPSCGVRQ